MVQILIDGIHIHTMHPFWADRYLEIRLVSPLLGCEVGFVMF
jgi:hypothetical protein